MKRISTLSLVFTVLLFSACNQEPKKESSMPNDNPFAKTSELPFEVPDFDAIKNKHFKPAILKGIETKEKEIEKIANNEEEPTFENTFIPLEKSGQDLNRVLRVFSLLTGAHTNDSLKAVREEMAPKLSALSDAIYLNDKLFQRVKTIHNQVDSLDLDAESKRLVEVYYKNFELSGANLPDDKKEELKKLNEELAKQGTAFSNKLQDAGKAAALLVDDKEALKGLSDSEIKSAAQKAEEDDQEGKFEITLQNTTQQPDLQKLENRETRKKLFENSIHRADNGNEYDTQAILIKIAKIRAQQAELLGYENYAEWNLQDQMAKTPEAVQELLGQIVPAAIKKSQDEASDIQKQIDKSGENFKLEPWDWNYYAEKVRKEKYDLDENEIKPYFVLDSVLENGVFYAAHKLYGLNFKKRTDIPTYHEDVRVYEVSEENGDPIGIFYGDYYKRDSKRGGAWMSNIVGQSKLLDKKPVIYNVGNFSKAGEGEPQLMTFDDVITMFHEFGHALHGFFADQEYPTLSGTSVARDFVEFPSQFNEHWALYPDVLNNYAKHYETGDVISKELVDKIKKSSTFNQGYSMTELLAAAQLDMQWHSIPADQEIDSASQFEEEALKRTNLYSKEVPPRYRSSYFNHIWGSGYAAGYYAYIWTKVLDDDAYSWFEENDGLTRENGDRFRKMILSKGNTEDYNKMFKDFRGHEPDIEPFLRFKGLK